MEFLYVAIVNQGNRLIPVLYLIINSTLAMILVLNKCAGIITMKLCMKICSTTKFC